MSLTQVFKHFQKQIEFQNPNILDISQTQFSFRERLSLGVYWKHNWVESIFMANLIRLEFYLGIFATLLGMYPGDDNEEFMEPKSNKLTTQSLVYLVNL